MEQQVSNLLKALRRAQEDGYPHDFQLDEKGNLLTNQQEVSNPKIIEMVSCEHCGATLYLIACDNVKGTLVHHWESPSN